MKLMKVRIIIVGLILTLLAAMPVAAQDCPPVENYHVTCGMLPVPENRTLTDSPTIHIAYAVVHSYSAAPQPDPLVFIAGGPGNSGIQQMSGVVELMEDILATRDIIFFDQRGIGASQPSLYCTPELMAQTNGDQSAMINLMLQPDGRNSMALNCLARLESQGSDLAAYNTTQAASDLADLRIALGYEQWNLYGVSYGTYFALTMLRDHPEGVRSVILDSVVPLQANPWEDDGRELDMVFAGCAADWVCNAAYPQLGTVYQQLLADLNANPIQVSGISLNGDALALGLTTAGSQTFAIPYIPSLIYDLRDRDTRLLEMLLGIIGQIGGLSAMPLVYMCEEEAPFASVEQTGVSAEICGDWQVVEQRANDAVSSDIPTLLMAGQYDTSTPPAWAHLAAQTLTNSYVYEVIGNGHVTLNNPSSTCPNEIMLTFINTPTQAPDTTCLAGMRGVNFILRAQFSQPYALLAVVVLGVGVLTPASYTLFKQHWTFAWRAALRSVSWQIALATFVALVIGILVTASEAQRTGRDLPGLSVRVVEVVLTLIIGMQASFAFAPDDEPSLEILAACPRPLYYVLLERLTLLFTVYGGVATLTALVILTALSGDNLLLATVRWLAPALMATGIVTRITVLTRRASFGLLVMILLFFTTLIGGALLVQAFPVLSPLYPFLQPDEVSDTLYFLNRACLIVGGLALIVSAAWLTRSEERMLKSS